LKKLALTFAAAAALVASASQAAVPAYPDNPDVLWRGDFEDGVPSLTGHCSYGDNGWCKEQTVRPQQIQVSDDPVFEGRHAVRFEVKYGDVYPGMSDSRSLMSPPETLWEDEGNERWYRWQVLWPQDWVGSYPKWDELSTPSSRSNAGSIVEWHHDANGAVESAPRPLLRGEAHHHVPRRSGDQHLPRDLQSRRAAARPLARLRHAREVVVEPERGLPRDLDRRRERAAEAHDLEQVLRHAELPAHRTLP
jgi:hypothetical protein